MYRTAVTRDFVADDSHVFVGRHDLLPDRKSLSLGSFHIRVNRPQIDAVYKCAVDISSWNAVLLAGKWHSMNLDFAATRHGGALQEHLIVVHSFFVRGVGHVWCLVFTHNRGGLID